MVKILIFLAVILMPCIGFADTFSISYENGKTIRSYPDGTRPVVGLALSGGGARGIAHLGVIQALEDNGIRIERIAGTSMGSIVGGLYAAGYNSAYLVERFDNIDWTAALSRSPKRRRSHIGVKSIHDWPLFGLRFNGFKAQIPSSLSSGHNFMTLLTWLCLGPSYECRNDFDKLPIPFRPVATDLNRGEKVVISQGNLGRAIQASSTVPLLFTPVPWKDTFLVDGGLVDHLPVTVAREMGCDFVIASLVEESMHPAEQLDNIINIADQVTSIPTRRVTRLSKSLADFVVEPDMSQFSSADFTSTRAIVEQGRKAAQSAIPALIDSLENMTVSFRAARITTIEVIDNEEYTFVQGILDKYIQNGDSTRYASIANGIEVLWATGRYLSVSAELDVEDGSLTILTTRSPKSIRFHISGYTNSGGVDSTYTVIPNGSTPLNIKEALIRVESEIHRLQSEGLSLAHITSDAFNHADGILTVTITVPHITEIVIDEGLSLRNSVIIREVNMVAGTTFNINNVVSSLENLFGTNLFEWVYADIEPVGNGARLLLHVKEKKWIVARLGLRFDETNHTRARLSLSRENNFRYGNQLTTIFEASERNTLLMAESRSNRMFNTFYTYSIKAYKNYRLRYLYQTHSKSDDYADDRYGAIFSIGQHMDKLGNTMLKFKTETVWITTGPKEQLESTKKELRSIILQTLIDSYDRYPFPQSGFLNLMHIETTSEVMGGTDQFVKLFWGASLYRTLGRKHTFSGSFSLGTADPSLPDIEQFSLGGSPTRLNCYDWESSGSHYYADFHGLHHEEKTGNRLTAVSANYRLFIPRFFYLNFTYGIGNVWKKGDNITAKTLLQSYGTTGTFSTPVGLFSAGWGITSQGDEHISMAAGW
ncbi:patatin-like phospholipase family protein, partial [Candidatus Latescibacterota bacterium]